MCVQLASLHSYGSLALASSSLAAEECRPMLTAAVINASVLVILSCCWAGSSPACIPTPYDIAIHWLTIS